MKGFTLKVGGCGVGRWCLDREAKSLDTLITCIATKTRDRRWTVSFRFRTGSRGECSRRNGEAEADLDGRAAIGALVAVVPSRE